MMIDVRNVVLVDGSFSSRLRSLLVEHGMSQAELARRTGINYAALTATVNGRRRLTAREVGLLAHELGVDLLEFIGIADTVAEYGVLIEQREHLRGRLKAEQARASNTESSLRQARREAERAVEIVHQQLARVMGECEDLQRQLRAEGLRATKAEQAYAEGEQVRARLAGECKDLRRQIQAEQAGAEEARRRQNVQSFAEHKAWHRVAQVEAELADARKREESLEREREELRQKVQEFETEAAQRERAEQPSASDQRWWRDDGWVHDSTWEFRRRQLIDEPELDSDELVGPRATHPAAKPGSEGRKFSRPRSDGSVAHPVVEAVQRNELTLLSWRSGPITSICGVILVDPSTPRRRCCCCHRYEVDFCKRRLMERRAQCKDHALVGRTLSSLRFPVRSRAAHVL